MNLGIVGLGTMGFPMATVLLDAGHRIVAFDVSDTALARAEAVGAEIAVSLAELGAAASVVLLSLPEPAHVEAVVAGENGLLARPGDDLVIVDTSTVDPDTTRRMASAAATRGVGYLDAPILGRPDVCGHWTFPVGGDPADLVRARPVLDALGQRVEHVGAAGTGNAIKLLNNLMFGAINAITAEAMALCEAIGVPPQTFYETVAHSGAATVSPLFRQVGQKIVDGDFEPTFTVDLMHKDVALAVGMLENDQDALTIGNAVVSLASIARDAGFGGEDSSALVKVYASRLKA